MDSLDPFPKVISKTTQGFVEPGDPFDRGPVSTFSHRDEPAPAQLAVRMRHGLNSDAKALRDRP
jgi:hypothetical protein